MEIRRSWETNQKSSDSQILSATLSRYARLVLENIRREYPNKPGNTILDASRVQNPNSLHPAFYGCFDWHSSVHSHWFLVRLLRTFPEIPEATKIRQALNEHLSADRLTSEADYFRRTENAAFERPYGWGWLLKLAAEIGDWNDRDAKRWFANLQPLIEIIVERYCSFLPDLTYPIRSGVHSNTAFGISFALDFARFSGDRKFENLLLERSLAYFGEDADYPAAWEPSGEDFLSAALTEADLMSRILEQTEFERWFRHFLPGIEQNEPRTLLSPAEVTNLRDPRIVHLVGLNLSRAWCLLGIAEALSPENTACEILKSSAKLHTESALPLVESGDYHGDHWLASFALHLITHPFYGVLNERQYVENPARKKIIVSRCGITSKDNPIFNDPAQDAAIF